MWLKALIIKTPTHWPIIEGSGHWWPHRSSSGCWRRSQSPSNRFVPFPTRAVGRTHPALRHSLQCLCIPSITRFWTDFRPNRCLRWSTRAELYSWIYSTTSGRVLTVGTHGCPLAARPDPSSHYRHKTRASENPKSERLLRFGQIVYMRADRNIQLLNSYYKWTTNVGKCLLSASQRSMC